MSCSDVCRPALVSTQQKRNGEKKTRIHTTMCEFGSIVLYINLMFYANNVGVGGMAMPDAATCVCVLSARQIEEWQRK